MVEASEDVAVPARPRLRYAAAWLALVAAAAIAAHGVASLSHRDPPPPLLREWPASCPGPQCEVSALADAPSVREVEYTVLDGPVLDGATCVEPGPEWDAIADPERRRSLAQILCRVARRRAGERGHYSPTWPIRRYDEMLDEAWAFEPGRWHLAQRTAYLAWRFEGARAAQARRQALLPGWADLAALLCAAA
ncbi:MAG: hypothetical protein R3F59_38330, partial [Myxococcota bacterium]